jgi:hypothetical protein
MINGMITVIHLKGPPEKLGDVPLVSQLLQALTKAIGMTPHGQPQITYYPENSNAKGTHTILQPIAEPFLATQYLYESFIIYDNWPEQGYAHMIIDSCKPYMLAPIVLTIGALVPEFEIAIPHDPIRYGEWIFEQGG